MLDINMSDWDVWRLDQDRIYRKEREERKEKRVENSIAFDHTGFAADRGEGFGRKPFETRSIPGDGISGKHALVTGRVLFL
jgi:hypothetical protein